jgi:lipopolysaccharide export system permease protein
MPILWRYLLSSYFRVFALCVVSFIAILLVTRFKEIALFASSGASFLTILLFILYQIPHILPMAIPISGLIAAILLLQDLSYSHELTALRTSGLGLASLIYPLLVSGILLSFVNFAVCSELAPRCRTQSKKLVYQVTSINPLVLFQRESMIRLKDVFVDMKVLKTGKYAEDVLLVIRNRAHGRLGVMVAKELSADNELVNGKNVTFISSIDSKKENGFDHLVIENQKKMQTEGALLTQFLQSDGPTTNFDSLPLKMILAKKALSGVSSGQIGRVEQEICRRLSLSLAPFTFTLLGAAFGIGISRERSKKGIFWAIGLAAFFMISFIGAKSFKQSVPTACAFYCLPHLVLIFFSLRSLQRIAEGIE